MKRLIATTLAALTLTFVAAPAFAEFYIVQDATSKKCTVIDQKPTVTTMTVVGDNVGYKTRPEADSAMAKVVACTSK